MTVIDRREGLALFLLLVTITARFSFGWRVPLVAAGDELTVHSDLAVLILAGDIV